jgi:small nuclear ribonucleoprotein (snRNP)-like protein
MGSGSVQGSYFAEHDIVVELTNGELYRGHLLHAEGSMNLQLSNVVLTAKDGRVNKHVILHLRKNLPKTESQVVQAGKCVFTWQSSAIFSAAGNTTQVACSQVSGCYSSELRHYVASQFYLKESDGVFSGKSATRSFASWT